MKKLAHDHATWQQITANKCGLEYTNICIYLPKQISADALKRSRSKRARKRYTNTHKQLFKPVKLLG